MSGAAGATGAGADVPVGVNVPCLDAMALFLFHNHGRLAELGALFPDGAWTADWVLEHEVGGTEAWRQANADILDAPWLHKAPELVDADAARVATLLAAWGSAPDRDKGEAEIVVLCEKFGWLAITDDRQGRGALEDGGHEYSYVTSMLAMAAASGHAGMDVATAYEINRDIQAARAKPFIADEPRFRGVVTIAGRAWDSRGRPRWPQMLADWRIDALVDRSDQRQPSRRPRQI